jgi:uncharacterized membrane protein YtjA (UPF0391 family)
MRQRQTDVMVERRTIVRVIVVCGLMLALSVCSTRNVMDIICPPAGQCPNVSSGHGGGYWPGRGHELNEAAEKLGARDLSWRALLIRVGPASGLRENKQPTDTVLKLALFFLIVSIIAGLFGFTRISAATAGTAEMLFFIFIVAFVVFLVLGLVVGSAIF